MSIPVGRRIVAGVLILAAIATAFFAMHRSMNDPYAARIPHEDLYSDWYIFMGGDLWAYPQIVAENDDAPVALDDLIDSAQRYRTMLERGADPADVDLRMARETYLNDLRAVALSPTPENLLHVSFFSLGNTLRSSQDEGHPPFVQKLLASIRFLESTMYIASVESDRTVYDAAADTRGCLVAQLYEGGREARLLNCLDALEQRLSDFPLSDRSKVR